MKRFLSLLLYSLHRLLAPVAVAAMVVMAILLVAAAPARADTINVGAAFGAVEPFINSIVSALIVLLVGWVLWLVKMKLNLSIDDSSRDALQTWLQRQAASLVADGAVRINGLQINVSNSMLATAANLALKEIPDAVARFGLTPDKLAAMIVDKLPHVPSVAATLAVPAVATQPKI